MIALAKCVRGSFAGVDYQNDEEKILIDNDGRKCQGYYNLSSNKNSENWAEMKAIKKLTTIKKPFLVAVLSPPVETSKKMKFEDWRMLAEAYAKDFGFYENQWRFDVHAHSARKDEDTRHLHIYAARVDFSGINRVKEGRIGLRSNHWAQNYSRQNGWKTLDQIVSEKKNEMKHAIISSAKLSINFNDLHRNMATRGYAFTLSYSKKSDGTETLNGMRIMTLQDFQKRQKQEVATNMAVDIGLSKMPHLQQKKSLSPEDLEAAKNIGQRYLSEEERLLVLSKAQLTAKPGFTLSQLGRTKDDRITINQIVQLLSRNAEQLNKPKAISSDNAESVFAHAGGNGRQMSEILKTLLKPSYSLSPHDELFKKKRKYLPKRK